ncbi:sugar transferase [Phenylobacterium sp.]|uniref:sugar transferase n=1 Tax=Phenylobacterium sp. TaxID=1871053 RepID=UPI00281281CD|nr:sugar transferase [Phenylobacterium sp.]
MPLWMLAIPAFVLCFLVMPHVYGQLAFGPQYMRAYPGPFLNNVLLNCATNFAVILMSAHLKNRFDRKLAAVLSRSILLHGGLAFAILLLHLVYSSQVMIAGVVFSVVFGTLYMYLEHVAVRPRIAIVGASPPKALTKLAERYRGEFRLLEDPETDVRDCDLVLAPEMAELDLAWSAFVSRAMLSGVPVRHVAEFLEEADGIVSVEHFEVEHLPVGGLTSYRLRKRLLDVALIILTAPITVPLALLGALAVACTMGRPVLFVQDRAGFAGRPFRMYKLRTMRPMRPTDALQATTTGDNRITPVGAWLRRFRVDELPQLWNVLKGDMSIIGPRPEWTVLSDEYQKTFPAYAHRHLVRPGITGWAQVRSGYAADLDETKVKVGYDLFYIKNLSFSLDMQILARTVWTLVSGSGAR